MVQALKLRWNKFYSIISDDKEAEFCKVKKLAEKSEDERNDIIIKRRETGIPSKHMKITYFILNRIQSCGIP